MNPSQHLQEQVNGAVFLKKPLFYAAAQAPINNDAPSYFRTHIDGFARAHEQTKNAISELHARIDSVERSIKETDIQYKAEFASIRSVIAGIAKTVDDSSVNEDKYEVVVRGLPPALALTHKQITIAHLVALQHPDYAQHVVGWHEWTPKRRAVQVEPAQQVAAQATGDQTQPHLIQKPVCGLAFTLSSPFMRDSVFKKNAASAKPHLPGDLWN